MVVVVVVVEVVVVEAVVVVVVVIAVVVGLIVVAVVVVVVVVVSSVVVVVSSVVVVVMVVVAVDTSCGRELSGEIGACPQAVNIVIHNAKTLNKTAIFFIILSSSNNKKAQTIPVHRAVCAHKVITLLSFSACAVTRRPSFLIFIISYFNNFVKRDRLR